MKKFLLLFVIPVLFGCSPKEQESQTKEKFIMKSSIDKLSQDLVQKHGEKHKNRIEKGVSQVAALWTQSDGTIAEYEKFCFENFSSSEEELDNIFNIFSINYEVLRGHFNKITLDLQSRMNLECGPLQKIDKIFGGYNVGAHFTDDFFSNKIAFIIALNFPNYSLKGKSEKGDKWNRKDWAHARLGGIFDSRVPASLNQKNSEIRAKSELYISEYNIFTGKLHDKSGKKPFSENLKLLTHWNIRDEIKVNFGKPDGLSKQEILYAVMNKIITQEIPKEVINSEAYEWNPLENQLSKEGKDISPTFEPNTRYQIILDHFKIQKQIDPYYTELNTFIKRKFEGEMEVSDEEVETLFIKYLTSPQIKEVANLIKKRLGRYLKPFDIWYDGFKERSSLNESDLTKKTQQKFPDNLAFEKGIPEILKQLGFTKEKSEFIGSKIEVDQARGSGHAWGAEMKSEKAHLRTRIPKAGMEYKGFNIAMHELGHNVEQTISLQEVDYYLLNGVPNTAFTEALAFVFQRKDLEILGIKDQNTNKRFLESLDNAWMTYEIMGVSLVEMYVWRWLYQHPNATAQELKESVIQISKDVWNKYYADVIGINDQVILAIYSHMVNEPLYLSNYALGHLIEFQIKEYIDNKNFPVEIERIYKQGRLIPQVWMKQAVGKEISIEPLIQASSEALKNTKY